MSAPDPRAPEAGTSFAKETRVRPDPERPGRYLAEISDAWAAPLHPSGGMAGALALRAMQVESPHPEHRLRTMTTLFVSPVQHGALEIDVELLRPGRRMSHLRATLRNAGSSEVGHITTAAFGEAREGVAFSAATAPEVGPPESYPGPAEPPPGVPAFRAAFFERTEMRRVRLHHSFEEGWQGGRAEATRWIRYRETPRRPDGALDPFALPGLADTMPAAISQYMGPGHPFFHAPSVDLTMHFFAETHGDWLLTHTRANWAGDGYASAQIDLWDEERRLLAHATQVMLLRFPDPTSLGVA